MAFSERIKAGAEPLSCAVCRQPLREGRRVRNPDYALDAPLCPDCYAAFFKGRKTGMDVALTDDTARTRVRYRPAEPLEFDPFFRRREPSGGFEHPLPELNIPQIIRDCLFWAAFCAVLRLVLLVCGGEDAAQSLSSRLLGVLLPVGSLLWLTRYVYDLIRGILYGMGYTRQLVLLLAIAAMSLLAWYTRPGMLFW